ncbi:hypothetical protein GLYMA_19G150200v4 [Glycine max]|uniref:Uncharacterized protein n=1 Tax=Glycine max TaxID=3847 RepID=K7MYH5_SOYBN|nr:hypothetical protein GYH30_053113 [Glycine max]KRG95427.1 hypothetical protein GLYMA_19G150200v4 [Glycine max]
MEVAITRLPPETLLAEELSAVKKKLERIRADDERTKKILNEKHALLDAWMKELKYHCMVRTCSRVSPMRTLREKEQGKIVNEAPSQSEVLDFLI